MTKLISTSMFFDCLSKSYFVESNNNIIRIYLHVVRISDVFHKFNLISKICWLSWYEIQAFSYIERSNLLLKRPKTVWANCHETHTFRKFYYQVVLTTFSIQVFICWYEKHIINTVSIVFHTENLLRKLIKYKYDKRVSRETQSSCFLCLSRHERQTDWLWNWDGQTMEKWTIFVSLPICRICWSPNLSLIDSLLKQTRIIINILPRLCLPIIFIFCTFPYTSKKAHSGKVLSTCIRVETL